MVIAHLVRCHLLALLTAGLIGCGDEAPRLEAIARDDVILAFGDSLTFGTGAAAAESYPAVLGALIDREVVRSGVPGETSEGGLARLPAILDEVSPRLLILCLCGNDMLKKVDPEITRANLRAMLELARSKAIPVVLLGVPKPGLFADPPGFYAELADEFDLPYEGAVIKDVLYQNELKSDPIHPNARGYRRIAEAVAELLREAGGV